MIRTVLAVCPSLLFGMVCSARDISQKSLDTQLSNSTANHEANILLGVTS